MKFFILCSLILMSGCARRRSLLDDFNQKAEPVHINRLSCPAVKRLSFILTPHGTCVKWSPITAEQSLCGYSVYRWLPSRFIKRKPFFTCAHSVHECLDSSVVSGKSYCYLVRGRYKKADALFEGPASPIVLVRADLKR